MAVPGSTIQQALELALQYHQLGHLPQAEQIYRQILTQQPNNPDALNLLGALAAQVGQNSIAEDLIRRSIALQPNFALSHMNLGNALRNMGRLDEAIAAYRQALALQSGNPDAHNNLGLALASRGQFDDAIEAFRQAVALNPDFSYAHSNLLLNLHYLPRSDARSIAAEHVNWRRRHADPLKSFIQQHRNDRDPDRRLKVGYVSPDFRDHVLSRFLLPLLTAHDHQKFEIFAYAQVRAPDDVTRQLRAQAHHWHSLVGLSDHQAAERIRDDQIDILVDLAMHAADHRLLVFAQKPAPVQVTYLAYCSTTGLDTIDYRLSDAYLDPPGTDESVYSEQTLRLPETYWCYQPGIAPIDPGPLPALSQGHVRFGCLNNFCKVSAAALAAWARILSAVPNSRFLLHAQEGGHRQEVLKSLSREGVESCHVQFVTRVSLPEYYGLHHAMDIALDPFPYGGGATTCDALWMGVPVVSLIGKTAVGRGGWSILSNIGLPDLVARSEDEYVHIAVSLANDLPRLAKLRSTLRQQMADSPLMNTPRFARNIEAVYRQMWRRWCGAAHGTAVGPTL